MSRNALWSGVFALLLSGGLIGYGLMRFGSPGALAAAARGEVLHIQPPRTLGALKPRESLSIPIRVRNLTASPLKILGSLASCGCTSGADGLPLELRPAEVRDLVVHLTAPVREPGPFTVEMIFYVNASGEPPRTLLRGTISPAPSGNGAPATRG
jgi:hypothetical protein